MPLVNRLLDKVGGGINRSAAGSGDLEAEVARLRDDQRLLESALKRALHELDRLRGELSDLRAGAVAVNPANNPAVNGHNAHAAPPAVVPETPKPAPKPVEVAAPKPAPVEAKVEPAFLAAAAALPALAVDAPPPVEDNDSTRAKAAGLRLTIDRNECIGCGTCVEHEDGVFHLNDNEGKAYVINQLGVMEGIQDAIDACPVTCISWKPPHLAED